jgi:predicted NBD/HSP70 family sugar kinase
MAVTSLVKKRNMHDVIKAIKYHGPLSNADIVRLTGLTSATATNFTKELADKGLINEEGPADSTGGRRAFLYRFNPKRFYIVGVVISIKKISVGILDLDLNIIQKNECPYDFCGHTVEQGIQYIADKVKTVIAGYDMANIAGVGISVPGPVNFEKGLIYRLTNIPNWKNIALKDIMEKILNLKVVVDKDSNCNAFCFHWLDGDNGNKNLVYLSTVEGTGSGIIINGAVHRGDHGVAGEIGHISIDVNGELCNCGNHGCIEHFASNLGILNSAKEKLKSGCVSSLTGACGDDPDSLSFEMIIHAAKQGDAMSSEILWKAADYISVCIDNVIKAYDPSQIILDSRWLNDFQDLYFYIVNKVFESTNFVDRQDVSIRLNNVDELFLKGAGTLILESQFNWNNGESLLLQF